MNCHGNPWHTLHTADWQPGHVLYNICEALTDCFCVLASCGVRINSLDCHLSVWSVDEELIVLHFFHLSTSGVHSLLIMFVALTWLTVMFSHQGKRIANFNRHAGCFCANSQFGGDACCMCWMFKADTVCLQWPGRLPRFPLRPGLRASLRKAVLMTVAQRPNVSQQRREKLARLGSLDLVTEFSMRNESK